MLTRPLHLLSALALHPLAASHGRTRGPAARANRPVPTPPLSRFAPYVMVLVHPVLVVAYATKTAVLGRSAYRAPACPLTRRWIHPPGSGAHLTPLSILSPRHLSSRRVRRLSPAARPPLSTVPPHSPRPRPPPSLTPLSSLRCAPPPPASPATNCTPISDASLLRSVPCHRIGRGHGCVLVASSALLT